MEAFDRLKALIARSCHSLLSVEQFCSESGLDYQHIRKPFRRMVGMPLSEYYQRCRQRKAETLLAEPDKRIFEVAYDLGFHDEANFSNWFKHRTGMSPSKYRKHVRRGE